MALDGDFVLLSASGVGTTATLKFPLMAEE